MKQMALFLLGLVFFTPQSLLAQDTLYVENFETGGASFVLNTPDLGGATNGQNAFVVNNAYTGGSGQLICLGFPFSYTVVNTPAQPAGITNSPSSYYLHTISDEAIADNIFCSSFSAADGICILNETNFSKMNTGVNTTGYQNVNLSFWWNCGGGQAIHGEVYFSTNGGTSWTQITSPIAQYKNQLTWAQISLSDPLFDNQADLRFGFRFVNNTSNTASDPGFSIDDLVLTGTANSNLVVDAVSDSLFCPGDTFSLQYTATNPYNAGNVFTAELSDAVGSFAAPVQIGTLGATGSGSIACTIPPGQAAGTGYRVRITATGPADTSAVYGTDLTVQGPPTAGTIAANQATICPGDQVSLTYTGPGAVAWYTSGDGLNYTLAATFVNPYVDSPGGTTYYMAVVAGDCGQDSSNVVQVVVQELAHAGQVNAIRDSVCLGDSVFLSTAGSNGNLQWWESTDGQSFTAIAGAADSSLAYGPVNQHLFFQVLANGACNSVDSSATYEIWVDSLDALFAYNQLGATFAFTDASFGAVAWNWDFGDGNTSTDVSPVHTYAQSGNYDVTLIVSSASGCTDTVMVTIGVVVGLADEIEVGELEVFPNPFGSELRIRYQGQALEAARLSVYDLRGKELMQADQGALPSGTASWTLDMSALPAGTYLLEFRTDQGRMLRRIVRQ